MSIFSIFFGNCRLISDGINYQLLTLYALLATRLNLMPDSVRFGALAFPAFFRALIFGTALWFLPHHFGRRLPLEKWFWHTGLFEMVTLLVSITLVSLLLRS